MARHCEVSRSQQKSAFRHCEDAVLNFIPAGTYMYVVKVEMTDRYTSIQVRCTHPDPRQLAWPSSGHPEAWAVLWARAPVSPDDAIMGMMSAVPVSHDDARQTIAFYDAKRRKPATEACVHACDHTLTGSRWDDLLGSIGSRCGRRCVGQTKHEGLHRCVFHTADAPAGAAASAGGGNATPASSASGLARPDESPDLFRCRGGCDHVLTSEEALVSVGFRCGSRCVGELNHEGLHQCERHVGGAAALRRCQRRCGAAASASGGEVFASTMVPGGFESRGDCEEQQHQQALRQEAAALVDAYRQASRQDAERRRILLERIDAAAYREAAMEAEFGGREGSPGPRPGRAPAASASGCPAAGLPPSPAATGTPFRGLWAGGGIVACPPPRPTAPAASASGNAAPAAATFKEPPTIEGPPPIKAPPRKRR